MNPNELKAQMARYGDSNLKLAKALGISEATFSCKLNGKRNSCFTQTEIQTIIDRYKLTPDGVMVIFFASEVSDTETMLQK